MKKKKRLALIVTVCVVVIGIVLAVVFIGRTPEAADAQTVAVTRGAIVITAPVRGNLEMPDKAYLSFGVTGTVEEILVARGDSVEEDQILARLDAPSLELNVEMAELQVEIAAKQVKAARAQYEIALINLEDAGAVPGFGESTEVLEQRVEMARASWETAKLNLEMAELNLEMAELNLEKAVIVAPFDGLVADITISEGQEISTAALAAPAISLLGAGEMQMRGFIDELDIAVVELGQNVTILVDALPDAEVQGTVAFVSPVGTVRLGVVSYETTITVHDPPQQLRDGMSATADIIIERHDDVLVIPNRAIRGTQEAPTVVVDIEGQYEERAIVLGLSDGINTEVVLGLEEGDKVVLGTLSASESQPHPPFGILR
ncbi:MAG: efflux RND transporter periplasmic adaptor subunit [Dehalococcoidia bacterium]